MSLGSLYDTLKQKTLQLQWSDRCLIATQMIKGINYLHTRHKPILHRDIKSLNILMKRNGEDFLVKVADFGLAVVRRETSRQSSYTHSVGTLLWKAPELLKMGKHTEASDVYALGIVFWELGAGCEPYEESDESTISEFVRRGDRLDIPASFPHSFAELISRAWGHEPRTRPNCQQLLSLIEDISRDFTRSNETQPPTVIPTIPANARWGQNGLTVAGGHELGCGTNQLNYPNGLCVDDDQAVIVGDYNNHRIIQWNLGDTNGQVVAGGNGDGNWLDQLKYPTDVLIDKETNSLIICDYENRRVVRWSRQSSITQGELLVDNILCFGLAMDDQKYLYVSDEEKHAVRRYQFGDKNGIIVAGGNGEGDGLNQLNLPTYLFVDRQQSVYVSDWYNHRVMKWVKGAQVGIVVAGGQCSGYAQTQLSYPRGLFVDTLGTLYVAQWGNDRVIRWPQGALQGTVVLDGNGEGAEANQSNSPLQNLNLKYFNVVNLID
ncbi:unnamed protein product [Rotaria magnacalcarata]|uniref:Protein kinase domain-containing protein n=1 Tax=Rotaria magnacalcarata TaxID=392030 RepID=A0A816WUE1_9BILA|nr:unnamed protein product [Rotaria magnacalcarata]